jgi:hypothetical protein
MVIAQHAGPLARLTVVVVSVGTYLRLLVLPWGQTTYYGHMRESLAAGGYVEAAIVLGAAVAVTRWCGPGRPWAFVGTGWLLIHLLPVSNAVPIGVLAAERCLYLSSVGFAILAGGAFGAAATRWPPRAAHALAVAALLAGAGLSVRVCRTWESAGSHWAHTFADHPRSPKAGAMVVLLELAGRDRADADRLRQTDLILADVERLNPDLPELWLARAEWARLAGDEPRAREARRRAESLRPGSTRSPANGSRVPRPPK